MQRYDSKLFPVKKEYLVIVKVRDTISGRVRIPLEAKQKVLDPAFWPLNIKVRSWIPRPKFADQKDQQNVSRKEVKSKQQT